MEYFIPSDPSKPITNADLVRVNEVKMNPRGRWPAASLHVVNDLTVPRRAPRPTCCSDPRYLCPKCVHVLRSHTTNQQEVRTMITNCCGKHPLECSCDKPEPLGQPVWNFEQTDRSLPSTESTRNSDGKPAEPLGQPVMKF